jgi:hypothetical protein
MLVVCVHCVSMLCSLTVTIVLLGVFHGLAVLPIVLMLVPDDVWCKLKLATNTKQKAIDAETVLMKEPAVVVATL